MSFQRSGHVLLNKGLDKSIQRNQRKDNGHQGFRKELIILEVNFLCPDKRHLVGSRPQTDDKEVLT